MAVRNQRPLDRSRRIDMKAAARAAQSAGHGFQEVFWAHSDQICFRKAFASPTTKILGQSVATTLFQSSGDLTADRRYAFARDLFDRGDVEAAADLLAQTVELAPDFAAAWFALGGALEKLGRTDDAIAAFR